MGGPNHKDYSIYGVYIGVPLFRETHVLELQGAQGPCGKPSQPSHPKS